MFNSPENKAKHPLNENWIEYYKVLEGIRRTGVCNMWGASIYLKEFCPEIGEELSKEILLSWITNYDELNQRFGWQ